MADDEFSPLPKPKYLDFIQPKPLNFQQVSQDNDAEKNSQEKQVSSNPDAPQSVVSISKPSSATAYTTGYQESERYQPAQGQSRLGRDIQTGEYVEVTQTARRQGLYILGLQGYGKSGLLENLIIQDIKQHIGVCVLDPKGELIDNIIARLPERKKEQKVILLDINDKDFFPGLNLFACADPTSDREIQYTLNQVTHVFEKAFGVSQAATPRIYDYLYNCAYALIANPGYTMMDFRLLLNNAPFRSILLANVADEEVLDFWHTYYNPLSTSKQREEARQQEARELLRRLNDLTHDPLRYIVGQAQSTINLQQIMDEGKILLVKLNSRRFEKATNLIGSIIVALLLNASAVRQAKKQFNLYADEFQRFATEDFATLIEEARYAGIGVTMAHQNRGQLELSEQQADANLKKRTLSVGSLVVFRVPTDAVELAGQFPHEPEEAREVELEEESLEIREKEQMETIEVIDGVEPIKVNERQIVDHLLKQGHEDERVMQFVRTYLQPLFLTIEKNEKKPLEWYKKSSQKFTTQKAFIDLNIWLYEGMVNSDKLFHPLPESVVGLTQLLTSSSIKEDDPLYKFWCLKGIRESSGYDTYNTEVVKAVRPATEEWQEERMKTLDQLREAVLTLLPQQSEDFYALRRRLLTQPQLVSLYRNAVDKRSLYDADQKILKIMDEWEKEIKEGGGRSWREIAARDYGVKPKPYQSQSEFSRILIVEMHVKYLPEIMRVISDAYFSFERFSEAAELCQFALSQHPLMTTASGLYQPRKRQQIIVHPEKTFPHPRVAITIPRRSEQDMVNEMARLLTNLPLYTAKVKITTATGIEEYEMRTLEPEKGIRGDALQKRIDGMKERNIQDGYLRKRTDVEAEIRQRRELYGVPPGEEPPTETPISRHPQR